MASKDRTLILTSVRGSVWFIGPASSLHVEMASPGADPRDERYIYPHEWLIFSVNYIVGKYTRQPWILWEFPKLESKSCLNYWVFFVRVCTYVSVCNYICSIIYTVYLYYLYVISTSEVFTSSSSSLESELDSLKLTIFTCVAFRDSSVRESKQMILFRYMSGHWIQQAVPFLFSVSLA